MALDIQTRTSSLETRRALNQAEGPAVRSLDPASKDLAGGAAAGGSDLAISDALRIEIRRCAAAERSANDAIAMAKTAEGALAQIGDRLERMRNLALVDGNQEPTGGDSAEIEFSNLRAEVDHIQRAVIYDGRSLLGSTAVEVEFDIGIDGGANDRVAATFGGLGLATLLAANIHPAGGGTSNSPSFLSRIDDAIGVIASQRARFGATVNRFTSAATTLQAMRASRSTGNSPLDGTQAAEELANLCKGQILGLASPALLAQANQLPQHAMSLLRSPSR